jgi:hypothetical protein
MRTKQESNSFLLSSPDLELRTHSGEQTSLLRCVVRSIQQQPDDRQFIDWVHIFEIVSLSAILPYLLFLTLLLTISISFFFLFADGAFKSHVSLNEQLIHQFLSGAPTRFTTVVCEIKITILFWQKTREE